MAAWVDQRSFIRLETPRALAIMSNPPSFLKDWISVSNFLSLTFTQLEPGS